MIIIRHTHSYSFKVVIRQQKQQQQFAINPMTLNKNDEEKKTNVQALAVCRMPNANNDTIEIDEYSEIHAAIQTEKCAHTAHSQTMKIWREKKYR